MQPLQESIKKEVIKHPLRNIEIIYEADKTTLTAQDEALIAGYVRLHDFELEMKNSAEKLHRQSVSICETLQALSEELIKVRGTFDKCRTFADKLSEPTYLFEETSLEKLEKAQRQTESELKAYHEKLLNMYETMKVMQEKINQYNETTENEVEPLYDEFSTLVTDHSANWENNSIDIAAFDRQFDQFRAYRTAVESQRENLMSECESATDNYTNLNDETTALYNVWHEFIKRSDLLARMSDLHTKAMGFTEN